MISRASLIYGVIFFLAIAFLSYLASIEIIGLKEFATGGMGLAGSFIGALFAFRLNEQREKAKEISIRKLSLNKALFTLLRQLNSMKSLQNEMSPYSNDFERGFNCPAFLAPDYSSVRLDLDSIAFLLEENFEDLLVRLTVEEECYRQALKSLTVRSEFLLKEVQPLIEEKGLNGKPMQPAHFIAIVGERVFGMAIGYGRQLHTQITESEKSLREIHEELFRAAKKLYPTTGFVKFADRTSDASAKVGASQ